MTIIANLAWRECWARGKTSTLVKEIFVINCKWLDGLISILKTSSISIWDDKTAIFTDCECMGSYSNKFISYEKLEISKPGFQTRIEAFAAFFVLIIIQRHNVTYFAKNSFHKSRFGNLDRSSWCKVTSEETSVQFNSMHLNFCYHFLCVLILWFWCFWIWMMLMKDFIVHGRPSWMMQKFWTRQNNQLWSHWYIWQQLWW